MVHGQDFQQILPLRQGAGQGICKFQPGQMGMILPKLPEALIPLLILLLEQRQEDLLLGLEIVIDGSSGKGSGLPDLFDGDLLKASGCIQLTAGGDNFLLPGGCQCFRSFWHMDLLTTHGLPATPGLHPGMSRW